MSDYILSPQVSRGLSDKLYDKRKGAALEVERYIARARVKVRHRATHAYMLACLHAPLNGVQVGKKTNQHTSLHTYTRTHTHTLAIARQQLTKARNCPLLNLVLTT